MGKAKLKRVRIRKAPAAPTAAFEATPERLAQAGNDNTMLVKAKIERAGERVVLARRFADAYVDRLLKAKRLTYAQWYAADWYREVYELTGIGQRVTANYGGSGAGECTYGMAATERQARARQRLRAARALLPPHMIELIDRVVLHDLAPLLANGQQRDRFAARIGRALQPVADWISAPTTA